VGALAGLSAFATVELIIVRVHAARATTGQISTICSAVTAVRVGIQAVNHLDTLALATATAFDLTRVIAAAAMLGLTLDPAAKAVGAPSGESGDAVAALPTVTRGVPWRSTHRAVAEAAVGGVGLEIDAPCCATAVIRRLRRTLAGEAVADGAPLGHGKRVIEAVVIVATISARKEVKDRYVATPLSPRAGRTTCSPDAVSADAGLTIIAGVTAPSAMVLISLQIDACGSTWGIRQIGAGALAVDACQITLAGIAAPAAVRFVVLEIDAERAALVFRATGLAGLAGTVDARGGAATSVPALPAVLGVRLGIDAGLAAFDCRRLALLVGLVLLLVLFLLRLSGRPVPSEQRGQRRGARRAQQRSPRRCGEDPSELIESRIFHTDSVLARSPSLRFGFSGPVGTTTVVYPN
jgi:hypothetical protein